MDYVEKAHKYARGVVSGKILACVHVRNVCQQQLDDLKEEKRGPYYYDKEAVEFICGFLECLEHVEGEWDSRTLVLEPWQCFIVARVFGWKKRSNGKRRFRNVYIEVPRKNGKSTFTAGIAIYMLALDDEPGAKVFSAATTRDQANIIFGEQAQAMLRNAPDVAAEIGVQVHANAITNSRGGSFRALSAEAANLEGKNVHFAGVDELHAHPNRKVWDVLRLGRGARKQPIIWAITTAGSDIAGVCYEQRDYAIKVAAGVIDDPSVFGLVYTLDEDDNWRDPATWSKANPNLGVSCSVEDLATEIKQVENNPAALSEVLRKRFNVWTGGGKSWIDIDKWRACGDPNLRIEDFKGQPCWVGVDLASKIDIAAMAMLFEHGGKRYLFRRCWIPEDAVKASTNRDQYEAWIRGGQLIASDGATIDFAAIRESVEALAKDYDVRSVACDPWQAHQFMQDLMAAGLPAVEYRNTIGNMTEPMKQLQADVYDGTLVHEACSFATWQVSNVIEKRDRKENVQPDKERSENKIDWVVASIFACGMFLREQNEPKAYAEHGLRVI